MPVSKMVASDTECARSTDNVGNLHEHNGIQNKVCTSIEHYRCVLCVYIECYRCVLLGRVHIHCRIELDCGLLGAQ